MKNGYYWLEPEDKSSPPFIAYIKDGGFFPIDHPDCIPMDDSSVVIIREVTALQRPRAATGSKKPRNPTTAERVAKVSGISPRMIAYAKLIKGCSPELMVAAKNHSELKLYKLAKIVKIADTEKREAAIDELLQICSKQDSISKDALKAFYEKWLSN